MCLYFLIRPKVYDYLGVPNRNMNSTEPEICRFYLHIYSGTKTQWIPYLTLPYDIQSFAFCVLLKRFLLQRGQKQGKNTLKSL